MSIRHLMKQHPKISVWRKTIRRHRRIRQLKMWMWCVMARATEMVRVAVSCHIIRRPTLWAPCRHSDRQSMFCYGESLFFANVLTNLNRRWLIRINNNCVAQRISDASKKRSGNTVAKVSRRCCSSDGGHAIGWWCYALDIRASAVATILNEIGIFAISPAGCFRFGSSQSLCHFPAATTAYQTIFGRTILGHRLFIDNHPVRWRSKWVEWQRR